MSTETVTSSIKRSETAMLLHDLRNIIATASLDLQTFASSDLTPVQDRSRLRMLRALSHAEALLLPQQAAEDAAAPWSLAALVHELGESVGLGLPLEVVGDCLMPSSMPQQAVFRILLNLVGNAVAAQRHQRDPHVAVAISQSTMGMLQIDITDGGPGLDRRLFETLSRGHGPESRAHGLGLATAARLAEGLGGFVRLMPSSAGARLRIVLPQGKGAALRLRLRRRRLLAHRGRWRA